MDTTQQFVEFVEAAFRASGLRHTTFGFKVAGDPNLISDLRRGREFRRKTREKIEKTIRDLERSSRKKGKAA